MIYKSLTSNSKNIEKIKISQYFNVTNLTFVTNFSLRCSAFYLEWCYMTDSSCYKLNKLHKRLFRLQRLKHILSSTTPVCQLQQHITLHYTSLYEETFMTYDYARYLIFSLYK